VGPASIDAFSGFGTARVSGRLTGIAANPTNANVIYVAAAGGGVWKTINGGASWSPMTDRQATLSMGAIALAPSNPNIIYAGTGEANNSQDSFYGRGVLKSVDGGATWKLLGTTIFNRVAISKIVVDPTNANTVYVAINGNVSNGTFSSGKVGVWKSTDGGTNWKNTTTGIANVDHNVDAFSDLVIDPSHPQTLYTAAGTIFGSPGNGIYKTINGGTSWTLAGDTPTGSSLGRIALAISKTSPQTLYASISISSGSHFGELLEMLKTTNGGTHWSTLPNTPNYLGSSGFGQGWYDTTLAVDPKNANVAFAGGSSNGGSPGIIETTDGGTNWNDIIDVFTGPHTDDHAMAFDANGKLLDGNDGGIWRLANPAPTNAQWTDLNSNLQITQFTGIALHPSNPNVAYGGSQDNGTEKFIGTLPWTQIAGGDGGFVRVNPASPNTVYHEFTGVSLQRSDDGGQTFMDVTSGINTSDLSNFYVPYVLDPSNSHRLLLGTNRVYQSVNQGDSWAPISAPGLNGWTSNAPIDSIAISKTKPATIYATAGGDIFVTFNNGAKWQKIDVPTAADHFSEIDVDPTNNLVAYVVRDQFNGGGASGHVFRTSNGGLTWKNITGNLPDIPANTLAIDPRTSILYVGTDTSVFASINGGTSWVNFGNGLPDARVIELELNQFDNILAAGTHGRGMFEEAVAHFKVTPSTTAPHAGVAFSITVTAEDPFGRTITNYTGTVHFSSTDPKGKLPGNTAFLASDHGSKKFTVILLSTGKRTITVDDVVEPAVSGSTTVTVGLLTTSSVLAANDIATQTLPAQAPSTQLSVAGAPTENFGQGAPIFPADRAAHMLLRRSPLTGWNSLSPLVLDDWFAQVPAFSRNDSDPVSS
jgi:photosystem II stability/assembly factor-like uncharacterized protein